MLKSCAVCRTDFEAKRAAAKYCGQTCRQRAHRRPEAASDAEVLSIPAELASELATLTVGPVTVATEAELKRADRIESALGQAAVALARRIDTAARETGASLAALARQHRETLAEAVKGAKAAADPLDELRARRERKRDAG